MTVRVEIADPLTVLAELPGGLAQCAIFTPPVHSTARRVQDRYLPVALIDEAHRVTRPDGTLLWDLAWSALPVHKLATVFAVLRWQVVPNASVMTAGFLLFSKQPSFYWQPGKPRLPIPRRTRDACGEPRRRRLASTERRAWCVHSQSPGRLASRRAALEWLIGAATSPVACGACGAPWSRHRTTARQQGPGCEHINPCGRSLVLDPCYQPGSLVRFAAQRHACNYLGVEPSDLEALR
jgi:hypothetical protein